MNQDVIARLSALESSPEALERTREYLRSRIGEILRPNEKVLICFPDDGPASLGALIRQVLLDCKCRPEFWGPDRRWKGLLCQAFVHNVDAVFGPPLVVLGLMKMAKATATPLNIYNAFLAGYPYASWLTDGIKRGLDCRIWGCYWIGAGSVVAGFTCDKEAGIHIREDIFEASIRSAAGEPMEDARRGHLTLRYKGEPELLYDCQETAKIWHQPCSCGCDDPRVVEAIYVGDDDLNKMALEERFLVWSSVLDYRMTRTDAGTALELVVFPGGSLPKIKSCTQVSIRYWNPETDCPICLGFNEKMTEKE